MRKGGKFSFQNSRRKSIMHSGKDYSYERKLMCRYFFLHRLRRIGITVKSRAEALLFTMIIQNSHPNFQ